MASSARATPALRAGVSLDRPALKDVYRDFYRDAPFVHVSDAPPSTKHVAGTNYCLVHPSIDPLTGAIVVASAIDNLGKGAAGAAVQCMNVMLGLPETAGPASRWRCSRSGKGGRRARHHDRRRRQRHDARRIRGGRGLLPASRPPAAGKLDLGILASERPAAVAAMFTRNAVKGDAVYVSQEHARNGRARASS